MRHTNAQIDDGLDKDPPVKAGQVESEFVSCAFAGT